MPDKKATREQEARLLPPPSNGQLVMVPLELLPAYMAVHGLQAQYSSRITIMREPHFVLHCIKNSSVSQEEKSA